MTRPWGFGLGDMAFHNEAMEYARKSNRAAEKAKKEREQKERAEEFEKRMGHYRYATLSEADK